MKKLMSGLFICAALVAFTSCKKEKKVNCSEQANKASAAMQAYMGDVESVEKCKEARAAYQAFINGDCFSSLNAQEKEIYQSALDAFDCDAR